MQSLTYNRVAQLCAVGGAGLPALSIVVLGIITAPETPTWAWEEPERVYPSVQPGADCELGRFYETCFWTPAAQVKLSGDVVIAFFSARRDLSHSTDTPIGKLKISSWALYPGVINRAYALRISGGDAEGLYRFWAGGMERVSCRPDCASNQINDGGAW